MLSISATARAQSEQPSPCSAMELSSTKCAPRTLASRAGAARSRRSNRPTSCGVILPAQKSYVGSKWPFVLYGLTLNDCFKKNNKYQSTLIVFSFSKQQYIKGTPCVSI